MNASIPAIAPKGTNGAPSGVIDTYPSTDPDCWWSASQCTTPKASGVKPDIAAMPEPRTLGYGFDDGPNCSHNAFYDYLNSKQQKATMFYIGSSVMIWPLQAQRAVADGHEICVHTWSHRSMTAFTNEQAFGELWYTMQAIKLVTGYTPTCWRPPLGDVDDRIRYIAQQLGLDTVLWKYDVFDWEANDPSVTPPVTPQDVQANYDKVIAAATSGTFNTTGAIMLAHELNNYTMQTAIDNYPKLAAAFDHLVPVGVGYNKTQPYVETNYSQPTFQACEFLALNLFSSIPVTFGPLHRPPLIVLLRRFPSYRRPKLTIPIFADVAARGGSVAGPPPSSSGAGAKPSGTSGSNTKSSGSGSGAQTTGSGAGVTLRVSGLTLVLAFIGALALVL
ncbi:Carbohydrate esterase family 4 protein [Mycena venus]|uniref:chitin deacetylase n=1 Tax=Mycena venus TaxID=2733690 RepID=A0A8H6YG43_9AGAR|nr:Carbohydrate esterase family 4 protein [Mycena venus]